MQVFLDPEQVLIMHTIQRLRALRLNWHQQELVL